MPGRTSATLWLTESAQLPAPRRASKTSDPASFPDMLAEKWDTRPDTGNQRPHPDSGHAVSPSSSTPPTRVAAQRLPGGILLYLISVALVAIATIAVFFGTGFSCLHIMWRKRPLVGIAATTGPKSSRRAPVFFNTSIMMTREPW